MSKIIVFSALILSSTIMTGCASGYRSTYTEGFWGPSVSERLATFSEKERNRTDWAVAEQVKKDPKFLKRKSAPEATITTISSDGTVTHSDVDVDYQATY